MNEAKGRIDSAEVQLQHQQGQQQGREKEGAEEVEGEGKEEKAEGEEANVTRVLLAQLKRRKREYRRLFASLAETKADLRVLQKCKQQVR